MVEALETRVVLLPLLWHHSKTSVFRVTRPLHVGRLQQTAPTHQELHKSSRFEHLHFFCYCWFLCPEMTQKYTNTYPIFMPLLLDWWWLLDQGLDYFLKLQHVFMYVFDCALHTDLRQRHPAKPCSFNCYLILFCNLTLSRCNLILSTCNKKRLPNCNLILSKHNLICLVAVRLCPIEPCSL